MNRWAEWTYGLNEQVWHRWKTVWLTYVRELPSLKAWNQSVLLQTHVSTAHSTWAAETVSKSTPQHIKYLLCIQILPWCFSRLPILQLCKVSSTDKKPRLSKVKSFLQGYHSWWVIAISGSNFLSSFIVMWMLISKDILSLTHSKPF